jgi:hypothetical protein
VLVSAGTMCLYYCKRLCLWEPCACKFDTMKESPNE